MPRKLRVEYPGAIHHVPNRGHLPARREPGVGFEHVPASFNRRHGCVRKWRWRWRSTGSMREHVSQRWPGKRALAAPKLSMVG